MGGKTNIPRESEVRKLEVSAIIFHEIILIELLKEILLTAERRFLRFHRKH